MSDAPKSSLLPKVIIGVIVVGIILCVGAFAAFYALGTALKAKMAQSGMSYTVNQQDKSGGFTFKTKEGEVNMQAGDNVSLPKTFPSYLAYPGAKVAAAVTTNDAMAVTLLTSNVEAETLLAWYKDSFAKNGWTITNPNLGGGLITAEGQGYKGMMTIIVDDTKGHIQINLTPDKN